jgi:hypothetical protein
VLRRIENWVPKKTLTKVYSAIILPYFDYCTLVWSNCSEYLLDKLRKMQNRAARVITGRRRYHTPSYEILREFNWKPLADLLGKNKVVFMYTKQKTTNYQQPLNNLFNLK